MAHDRTGRALASLAALVGLMAFLPAASAHVTLEKKDAIAGTTDKLVLRVPHGCEGAPTTTLRVRIPDNVTNVKPQPKPGWQLTTVKGKLATPITGDHGETISETVREIQWSGGRLDDAYYDEFAFRAALPKAPGTTLYFPVVQECETGVNRWIEIPEPGKARRDYKQPAPELRLLPAP
jgi:uncharacterized protein YcnI